MDRWRYFDITHRFHVVCNPTNVAKLDETIGLLRLEPGSSVLDIACGKAEMLVKMAEASDIHGVGVYLSPYAIAHAEEKTRQRVPDSDLRFFHMDGADYCRGQTEGFDVSICMGASWIYDGHRGTLRAMKATTRPGGVVIVGEPFFNTEPLQEYLDSEGWGRNAFSSHMGNVTIGREEGLVPIHAAVSSPDDWDRYETLQWYAVDDFAQRHPDDPDLCEIQEKFERSREIYLRWGRDTLGWAIYVFRVPK